MVKNLINAVMGCLSGRNWHSDKTCIRQKLGSKRLNPKKTCLFVKYGFILIGEAKNFPATRIELKN